MHRLLGWCLNSLGKALCLLSLLAGLGTAWLWRHSQQVYGDSVGVSLAGRSVGLWSDRAGLALVTNRGWPAPDSPSPLVRSYATQQDYGVGSFEVVRVIEESERTWLCFHCLRYSYIVGTKPMRRGADGLLFEAKGPAGTATATGGSVTAPHAVVIAAMALPPLLWLGLRARRLYLRRWRRRLGLCVRCGYDLRGNASGRCSECGEAVARDGKVAA